MITRASKIFSSRALARCVYHVRLVNIFKQAADRDRIIEE